jgi:Domain of unknown function (DUF1707)
MNINDRMRIADSDRDQAAAQLRDYYAEGRLTSEELDERITAALNARTAGDLRRVMADLPSPAVAQPGPGVPPYAAQAWGLRRRRGPRVLPLVLLLLFAAILLPGGWVFFALVKVFLLFWLLVALAGLIGAAVFRHRVRRVSRDRAGYLRDQGGPGAYGQGQSWRGPAWRAESRRGGDQGGW